MIRKLVNILDIYGQPIGVNYKGASAYKTKVGAMVSIFTIGLGLALAINKIIQMANKENANIQNMSKTLNLFSGTEIFNFAE